MAKKSKSYIQKGLHFDRMHPLFNSVIHALGGIAVGILITHPFADPHPLKWALFFGGISVLGHLYALWAQ